MIAEFALFTWSRIFITITLINHLCKVCEKELSSALNLKQHMNAKHGSGVPEVPCPDCGKHVKYLDMHMKVELSDNYIDSQVSFYLDLKVQHAKEGRPEPIKCSIEGCDILVNNNNMSTSQT